MGSGADKQDFNHLVADAAEHVREKEEARAKTEPPRERKSRLPLLMVLLVILAGAGVYNFLYFTSYERAALEREETYLKTSVYLTALMLDAESVEAGGYPSTLDAIGMDDPFLTYVPSDDGYVLMADGGAVSLEYRSGSDLSLFREAFQSLLPEEVVR